MVWSHVRDWCNVSWMGSTLWWFCQCCLFSISDLTCICTVFFAHPTLQASGTLPKDPLDPLVGSQGTSGHVPGPKAFLNTISNTWSCSLILVSVSEDPALSARWQWVKEHFKSVTWNGLLFYSGIYQSWNTSSIFQVDVEVWMINLLWLNDRHQY